MAEKLFLFGAGASKGSQKEGAPPLGNNLLRKLIDNIYEDIRDLPDHIQESLNSDFEAGMLELIDQHSTKVSIVQRALAHYLCGFDNNYDSLYLRLAVSMIHATQTAAICTLNYDLMLQRALLAQGVGCSGSGSGFYYGDTELCLPHGTSGLFLEGVAMSGGRFGNEGLQLFTGGEGLKIGAGGSVRLGGKYGAGFSGTTYKMVHDTRGIRGNIQSNDVPPVISNFQPDKYTIAGQNFIAGQRKRWQQLTTNAKKIVIIGVAVREHDTHIWEPLRETKAQIMYCSGESGGKGFEEWAEKHKRKGDTMLPGFWGEYFDDINDWMGL